MLAALAQLAKGDKPSETKEEAAPKGLAAPASEADESVLEAVMDEFRAAPDSKAALRSLRALISKLR